MKSSAIMDFIVELMKRFALKSPKFFQVLQIIAIIATLATGVPEFVDLLNSITGLHINLPDFWESIQSKTVAISALVMWLMAKLPVTNQQQPITGSGKTVSPWKALPYTDKKK